MISMLRLTEPWFSSAAIRLSVGKELIFKDRSIAVGLVAVAKPGAFFGTADRSQQAGKIHALGLGQINRAGP
jgi:hypothetical protein